MNCVFDGYAQHVRTLQDRYEALLLEQGLDGVLIYSGRPKIAFRDDHAYPFRVNPHFKAWLPLVEHPHCSLLIRPGRKPKLHYYNALDFWHQPAGEPQGPWVEHFEIELTEQADAQPLAIRSHGYWAFIGEESDLAHNWAIQAVNPQALLAPLEYARAVKTGYEQACLRAANQLAGKGHLAAKRQFEQGASEFEIQQAYLAATGLREQQLPYGNIVGLNQHAAVLHYQHYATQAPASLHSLLIDAGAEVNGYAADITRTYSAEAGLFADLIGALNQAQLQLNEQVRAGVSFQDLHLDTHLRIGGILQQFGLVKLSAQSQVEQGITGSFFPHGLGHLLGLQVHDVGGRQRAPEGGELAAPQEHPYLRMTRRLEVGMVVTIEPGLYFIPSLLAQLASSDAGNAVDWSLVDSLKPCGGIRIEDNLCVTAGAPDNYTRDALTYDPGSRLRPSSGAVGR